MVVLLFFLLSVFSLTSHAQGSPEPAVYGQLPASRSWSISPQGNYIAHINRGPEFDRFVIHDATSRKLIFAGNASDFKARSVYFATENHVIFSGSETRHVFGFRTPGEGSGAMVYNIAAEKFRLLLQNTPGLHPSQSSLGRIVGLNSTENYVYMPAFTDVRRPRYHLYRVDLDQGRGVIHSKGKGSTRDWFVNAKGKVIAREDFLVKDNKHRIYSKLSGKWKLVYELETDIPVINLQAVGSDGQSLLFTDGHNNHTALYSLSLETGVITGPVYSRDNADIDDLILDINRRLVAIQYSGFKPSYEFVDPALESLFFSMSELFPSSIIYLQSMSVDKKKVIFYISGPDAPGDYYLYEQNKDSIELIGKAYNVQTIAPMKAIHYSARDGLKIPAVLTLPTNGKVKNLPLIVFPHGGPAAYDNLQFDWLAQYLAAKGYLVLQPNFRGSTGFGYNFQEAGKGQWGQSMQDDVSDGVKALVEAGYADSSRVCIMGMSYGGYSALAGGAFTPQLYRCVIAINAVADIPAMISSTKYKYGAYHWVIAYWRDIIGDDREEKEKLQAISPINYAAQFQSPVLLVHGEDDTVVPIEQSEDMHEALQEESKSVSFVELEEEDHWLSTSDARLKLLKHIDAFLEMHNPIYNMPH